MRPAFIILPGILLTLSACGRGGATLDTDNVQAEWFPNGSRTSIVLENETETGPVQERQREGTAITLLYNSAGSGQGTLSINGAHPEPATVNWEKAESPDAFHFKTPSREIFVSGVRRTSKTGSTATLSDWSCQEQETTWIRAGKTGSMTTEHAGQ